MQIQPYLFFEGRTEEALEFYQGKLGAKVEFLMRYKDNPDPRHNPPNSGDKVMHCNFRIGDTQVMASDGNCSGKPSFQGFSLTFNAADEADARPGEYWTKTYAARVAADGAFEVIISEPARSNGTLKTWFAFETGAQTADGKLRGREGGIPKAYTYSRQQWTFK